MVLGLTGGKDAVSPNLTLLQEGVAVLAISISLLWFATITTFAWLYRAKFRVLHQPEGALCLAVAPFAAETRALPFVPRAAHRHSTHGHDGRARAEVKPGTRPGLREHFEASAQAELESAVRVSGAR